jgi:hypothetical protein
MRSAKGKHGRGGFEAFNSPACAESCGQRQKAHCLRLGHGRVSFLSYILKATMVSGAAVRPARTQMAAGHTEVVRPEYATASPRSAPRRGRPRRLGRPSACPSMGGVIVVTGGSEGLGDLDRHRARDRH